MDTAEVLRDTLHGEESKMEELLVEIKRRCDKRSKKQPKEKRVTKGNAKSRDKPKVAIGKRAKDGQDQFRETQRLYESDKAKLATKILDQKEGDQKCTLDPSIVEATYKERFGGVSQQVDLSSYPAPSSLVDNDLLLAPFMPKEVKTTLARSKKDSRVPAPVKENRSILLPKGSTGFDDINNWQPLTIASVLLRLYKNVIASRVSWLVDMNPRQRGFVSAPGCGENGFLLKQIIKHSKAKRQSLCVTFLDLAKAFDTVSHKHSRGAEAVWDG